MNKWNLTKLDEPINACMIVAHPDDETIFAGGLMLSNPSWKWHVICATHKASDIPRGTQFVAAMKSFEMYGLTDLTYEFLGLEDDKGTFHDKIVDRQYDQRFQKWTESLKQRNISADIIFSHNRFGEYGHSRHKALSQIVSNLYSNVWQFVSPIDGKFPPELMSKKVNAITLSDKIQKQKLDIFEHNYVSEKKIWINLKETMDFEFFSGKEVFAHYK